MTQEQDSEGQVRQSEAKDGPRVLLVDDAAAIRNALRGVLEDAGIEVVGEALDGVQGVAMVGSLRPDVVLMDLRMPSSNGFQATEQIVQEHPAVRVVVLSAYETGGVGRSGPSRRRLRLPPQALWRRPHPRRGGRGMEVRQRHHSLT